MRGIKIVIVIKMGDSEIAMMIMLDILLFIVLMGGNCDFDND